ncbi:ClpXP protease specificity-enhancing factor [Moritella marina]|nr:ClpXP protease specificity-enhancing factor [Moritella marina]
MDKMTPIRPYLLRSHYEWLLDNDLTPHIVVDAHIAGVYVPQQFVQDGQIVLNIAPSAVVAFELNNTALSFNARFGGVPFDVYVPIAAITAIYARENGAGSMFEPEQAYIDQAEQESAEAAVEPSEEKSTPALVSAPAASSESKSEATERPKPAKGKPALRVIK